MRLQQKILAPSLFYKIICLIFVLLLCFVYLDQNNVHIVSDKVWRLSKVHYYCEEIFLQENVNSVFVVNFHSNVDRLEENSDLKCAKETKIVFVKTHKVHASLKQRINVFTSFCMLFANNFLLFQCASSTLQNILFRFGEHNNLNFVLPDYGGNLGGNK